MYILLYVEKDFWIDLMFHTSRHRHFAIFFCPFNVTWNYRNSNSSRGGSGTGYYAPRRQPHNSFRNSTKHSKNHTTLTPIADRFSRSIFRLACHEIFGVAPARYAMYAVFARGGNYARVQKSKTRRIPAYVEEANLMHACNKHDAHCAVRMLKPETCAVLWHSPGHGTAQRSTVYGTVRFFARNTPSVAAI